MAEERRPPVYGLWNEVIGEWFNPGTPKPYFPSPEDARRVLPLVLRQYAMGKWEVREYPLEEPETAFEPSEAPPIEPAQPVPGR